MRLASLKEIRVIGQVFSPGRLPEFHFLKQWATAAQLAPLMPPSGIQGPRLRFCPTPTTLGLQATRGPAPRDNHFLTHPALCVPHSAPLP